MEDKIIILAASLGGPPLVNDILSGLQPSFDLPVLVLQQMESDFSEPLTQAWSRTSVLRMVRLSGEEDILKGSAYVVPYAVYPVISQHGPGRCVTPRSLKSGEDVNHQWGRTIRECAKKYQVILILLSYVGLDIYQLHESLEVLRDNNGTIIRCCPINDSTGDPEEDANENAVWLDMEVDQIVEYLNRISRGSFIPARSETGR